MRPYFEKGGVIYDQAYKGLFHKRIECLQYNAALQITGRFRGLSR